ncbi:ATP-grasp peptide maturase system methyltransferase [Streptomyces sp. PTM05]|uniref:Protein-L-isoaspartate O-methyltransferase n=1 Tax=Streptantibioticus parmotrematis TaxID=2873249 RepID=A0ABS7QYA6_9ACTN|nr:ATP-grasp peptide maturase system methyltransferase [Streptantibioticus parmotrematis]MBY8887671.1 ATP-grasp peptide maturase system methyltransferase [Streptantibioticus parmotrematis]
MNNGQKQQTRWGLAEQACAEGSPWREAVATVPREVCLGDAVFRDEGGRWAVVRRPDVGDEAWLRMACLDRTWVTQVDGVHADDDAPEDLAGGPTCSSTRPSLVVRMLDLAGIAEGDQVLEVGTGTGYSTALLRHRLGADRVTSVECDPAIARRAADALRAFGPAPHLVVGDGLRGHAERAPYDALVATCAVRSLPYSWLAQIREGGTVVACLGGWMGASGIVRATVNADGGAQGRFSGEPGAFMPARPHAPGPRPDFFRYAGDVRECRVPPDELDHPGAALVAQLAAPSAELAYADGAPLLRDFGTGSQAWTERADEGWVVHQHGPLRLWDQVEDAIRRWRAAGAPGLDAFGVSISADNVQRVWLGNPDGPASWPLPV